MASVTIRNVTKAYGGGGGEESVIALEDVSLEVNDQEFLSVVGPSGCGKTTLLRVTDGLLDYDGGEVLLDGQQVVSSGQDRGMVFQDFNLLPWRTVQQNVQFGLELAGVDTESREERTQKHIQLVGLEGFENSYPQELSGGMQQRVGIARALAIDPEVLLMDEPFGALDAQTREYLQEELLRIWEENKKTVVFITHNIEESIYLSDKVAVMSPRPGRIRRIIEVPFERPRYDSDLKATQEFTELRQEIWGLLKHDVVEAEAA